MSSKPIFFRRTVFVTAIVTIGLGIACSKGESAEAKSGANAAAASPAASAPAGPGSVAAPATGAAPAPAGAAATPPVDPVLTEDQLPALVAKLDGVEITKSDLLSRATEARGALAQRGTQQPPPTKGFYRHVLDDIIGNRLLFQDLQRQGKAATDAEVEQQLATIRSQFHADADFDQALAARGFDRARLKRDILESVTVQKWVASTVVPSITISDADLQKFYELNESHLVEPEKVRARHILLRVEQSATPEVKAAQRRKIDEIRVRLAGGADFAAVAQESSDDKASGARGGDLGWFHRGQMVPEFEQPVFALQPKKLSDVIESRFGFHLVEVIEKQAQQKLPFDKVKERLTNMLKQRQLEEKVRSRVNELGAKSKIEILL
jgi:peptidyl-prolyl cis-trans isomerase C